MYKDIHYSTKSNSIFYHLTKRNEEIVKHGTCHVHPLLNLPPPPPRFPSGMERFVIWPQPAFSALCLASLYTSYTWSKEHIAAQHSPIFLLLFVLSLLLNALFPTSALFFFKTGLTRDLF